jgi:hypothetical protein
MAIKKTLKPITKAAAAPKAPASPLRVNTEWRRLLIENESRSKPLTDDQLIAAMQKLFPEKKNKTTILRCSMIRSIYNKGTSMFKKFGPAGSKTNPRSFAYDAKGQKMEGGAVIVPKSTKAKAPAPKMEKPTKTAKRAAKGANADVAFAADDEEVVEDG